MSIPVFLSSDNNYVPYMAALIVSAAENTDAFIDFYILNSAISKSNLIHIENLANIYKNIAIEIININTDNDLPNINADLLPRHMTISTYNRLLIPQKKPLINKAIYLDTDIIVAGDFKYLFNHDLQSYALAGVPGQNKFWSDACIANLDLSPKHEIFNSGVLLMNLQKFRELDITSDLFKIYDRYKDRIMFGDQDLMNVYFENNYLKLEKKYNYEACCEDTCDDFVIRHYTTDTKPWQISPDLKSQFIKNSDLFWYYLNKTPFYDYVLKKCIYKTKQSILALRLRSAMNKISRKNSVDSKNK